MVWNFTSLPHAFAPPPVCRTRTLRLSKASEQEKRDSMLSNVLWHAQVAFRRYRGHHRYASWARITHESRTDVQYFFHIDKHFVIFVTTRWIEDSSDNCNMHIPSCWIKRFEGTQKRHYLNIGVSWNFLSSRYIFERLKLRRFTKGLLYNRAKLTS